MRKLANANRLQSNNQLSFSIGMLYDKIGQYKQAFKYISYNQVRQPINTKSVERWKRYGKKFWPR